MGEVTSGRIPVLRANGANHASLGQRPRIWNPESATRAKGPIYALSMPESHAFALIHIVFSTKNRMANLNAEIRPPLHAYLATVARNAGCDCYRAGGVADHVHLAVRLSRTSTIAYLVQELKTKSSKWLRTQSPLLAHFAWQRGYGAFSVGPADLGALQAYIEAQEEHHRTRSFQEEPLPGALPQAGMATRLWRLVGYASNGRNLRCCWSYCSMRPVRMS